MTKIYTYRKNGNNGTSYFAFMLYLYVNGMQKTFHTSGLTTKFKKDEGLVRLSRKQVKEGILPWINDGYIYSPSDKEEEDVITYITRIIKEENRKNKILFFLKLKPYKNGY